MKIKILALIVMMTVLSASFGVSTPGDTQISVLYNGAKVITDVAPKVVEGIPLVPLRAVLEIFGAAVNFDPLTKMITAVRTSREEGTRRIVLTIGDKNAAVTVNGIMKEYVLDTEPVVTGSRVLVPLGFIGEALGAEVEWDSIDQQMRIGTAINIWDEAFDPWKDLNAYQAVYVVNEYLALLQGAVWGGALYEYYPILFSKRVQEAPEPWSLVWQPSMPGMVGTSVCRLKFRVLDGHIAGKDDKGNIIYEIAASVQSYDPRAGEPVFTDWIKAYRVINEEYIRKDGGKAVHWVIDGERTIREVKMRSEDMPDFWDDLN
jgi:hypothetical protein